MISGAIIEAEDRPGETSLCGAIFDSEIYIFKILIVRGANPLARSKGALVRLTPIGASHRDREVTAERMEENRNLLNEVEVAWKLSGKKYISIHSGI